MQNITLRFKKMLFPTKYSAQIFGSLEAILRNMTKKICNRSKKCFSHQHVPHTTKLKILLF